ncbi:hypothetical protein Tsubulata_001121 [Turnera subulata]|uniref:Uncharacterized protein n=1 Tax=Turnera subulata TaxID=218843 RepID=A0A9Q0G2T4_9ROSI|nr:hypothetical protein Tsubulata_001121 [Turnera subulata]
MPSKDLVIVDSCGNSHGKSTLVVDFTCVDELIHSGSRATRPKEKASAAALVPSASSSSAERAIDQGMVSNPPLSMPHNSSSSTWVNIAMEGLALSCVPLLLRLWDSKVQKLYVSSSILPVWDQLRNVPLELMTTEALGYLTSALGKPLHMEQDCAQLFQSDRINIACQTKKQSPKWMPKPSIVSDIRSTNASITLPFSSTTMPAVNTSQVTPPIVVPSTTVTTPIAPILRNSN